jgi:hypothetical protein
VDRHCPRPHVGRSDSVFTPALPYKLDSASSFLLLAATVTAALWLGHNARQWYRHPQHRRPRGIWLSAAATLSLLGLLLTVVTPQEEHGYITAHCDYGIEGFGRGMVWAKIEPHDAGATHTVRVRWGGWIGQPKPVPLYEETYFTFLKRDWHSGPADVSVDPPAKITCGDGRPPPDRPSIHISGDEWKREPAGTPQTMPSTSAPASASGRASLVVDGGDPSGCTSDARRVHEQPVFTLAGAPLGSLQLMQSPNCKAMWGRLAVTQMANRTMVGT